MKNYQLDILVDVLCNSMEFYSKEEFVENLHKETGLSKKHLEIIFDEYWALDPKIRMEYDFSFNSEKWIEEFILVIINSDY